MWISWGQCLWRAGLYSSSLAFLLLACWQGSASTSDFLWFLTVPAYQPPPPAEGLCQGNSKLLSPTGAGCICGVNTYCSDLFFSPLEFGHHPWPWRALRIMPGWPSDKLTRRPCLTIPSHSSLKSGLPWALTSVLSPRLDPFQGWKNEEKGWRQHMG